MEPGGSQVQSESTAAERSAEHSSAPAPASPARVERRRKPRTWETPPAPVPPPHLEDYKAIVGTAEIDELPFSARELRERP